MFPAIETALVGMKAGDEKTVDVDFPAEWRVPAFAGKTVKVTLTATKVSEPVLPDVDGAFIKSFGVRSGDAEAATPTSSAWTSAATWSASSRAR